MKLISALLCLCLTFNVLAASGTVQELERALDEYQYALTVEWDQKDASFMEAKTEEFHQAVAVLMDQGLTEKEVMSLMSQKIKNSKDLEAMTLKIKLLTKKATSPSEMAKIVSDNAKSLYTTGASWDGYVFASIAGGIGFIALMVFLSVRSSKRTCVATAQGTQCGWYSQYQDGPQFYQCYEVTYCTQYEDNN
jgi:hypothetical protein